MCIPSQTQKPLWGNLQRPRLLHAKAQFEIRLPVVKQNIELFCKFWHVSCKGNKAVSVIFRWRMCFYNLIGGFQDMYLTWLCIYYISHKLLQGQNLRNMKILTLFCWPLFSQMVGLQIMYFWLTHTHKLSLSIFMWKRKILVINEKKIRPLKNTSLGGENRSCDQTEKSHIWKYMYKVKKNEYVNSNSCLSLLTLFTFYQIYYRKCLVYLFKILVL